MRDTRNTLRVLVEDSTGPLSESRFAWLLGELYVDVDAEIERRTDVELRRDAEPIVDHYSRAKAAGLFLTQDAASDSRNVEIDPPDWWCRESELILDQQTSWQSAALILFGQPRDKLIPFDQLEGFLTDQLERQRVEGDMALLDYPAPTPVGIEQVPLRIFRGCSQAEYLRMGGRDEWVRAKEDPLRDEFLADTWARKHEQPLWKLRQMAARFSKRYGFAPVQAVGYLLSNLRSPRPWLGVSPGWRTDGDTWRWQFLISVGSPHVSPDAVAAAYARTLDQLRLRQPPKRSGRNSRRVLYTWVLEQRSGNPIWGSQSSTGVGPTRWPRASCQTGRSPTRTPTPCDPAFNQKLKDLASNR
jgi:hypothetical protein